MPTDPSLRALRNANPRTQPGFAESIERYNALGTQIATTPIAAPRRPHLGTRRRLIALSASAAAALSLAAALVALTLSAASPEGAYAAARKAVAATSAGAVDSGTMTMTVNLGGTSRNNMTARWNGNDISISGDLIGGDQQVELVGGGVYVQGPDGTWLHYASESDADFPAGQMLQLAREYVSGSRADQIVLLVPGLQKTVQPDGSTVYTGTIPTDTPAEVAASGQPGVSLGPSLPHFRRGAQFHMLVGSDGLVRQISESAEFADYGPLTWTIQYSQLGSTPSISAPASSTEGVPGSRQPPAESGQSESPHPLVTP
jgi:hypothetical protein